MQFFKKHYEKVLLSIVLLGLAVAAAALPLQVSRVQSYLETKRTEIQRTPPKPFEGVDLSTNRAVIKRLAGTVDLNFSEPHNLFNPVQWKKRPDGTYVKIPSSQMTGPAGLVINKIDELNLTITFDSVDKSGGPRYGFIITREGDPTPRRRQTAKLNERNSLFTLEQVAGPPEAPTGFKMRLKDEKDSITIQADKPYVRIIGYEAELRHPIHGQTYTKRAKDTIRFPGDSETYKIVAITQNEVVLSASSTGKRTKLTLNNTNVTANATPSSN